MTRALVAAVLAVVAFSCASAPQPAGNAPAAGADACNADVNAAADSVDAVIAANQACSVDSDCIVVTGASCYDHCTRIMGQAGKPAYDKAVADANANQCADFKAKNCPSPVPPPCAPPPPVSCKAGRCATAGM